MENLPICVKYLTQARDMSHHLRNQWGQPSQYKHVTLPVEKFPL